MKEQDAHVYADAFKKGGIPPWLHGLYMHWLELLKEPFRGVTSDGEFNRTDNGILDSKLTSPHERQCEAGTFSASGRRDPNPTDRRCHEHSRFIVG